MKKAISLICVFVLVLMMTACSGSAPAANSSSTAAASPAPADDSAPAPDSAAPVDNDKITIAYCVKTLQEERWQREIEGCEAAAKELGVEFISNVANGDAQMQISQIENLVTQGVDVILVTAVDSGALSNAIESARNAGVKIVIYDQPLENSGGDAFVGYRDETNGELIASTIRDLNVSGNVALLHGDETSGISLLVKGEKDVLADCDVEIVFEQYCLNWGAEAALAHAQNALTLQNNDIQAFVCMNDGIASGAIQALEEVGLAGQVVVTGMDCELSAVQRIVKGTQTSTLYKDSNALSRAAIETALALAKNEPVQSEFSINFNVNDMPHVVVNSVVVTKDKVDSVLVDGGIFTKEEIYG